MGTFTPEAADGEAMQLKPVWTGSSTALGWAMVFVPRDVVHIEARSWPEDPTRARWICVTRRSGSSGTVFFLSEMDAVWLVEMGHRRLKTYCLSKTTSLTH